MNAAPYQRALSIQVDNYQQTVLGLRALANEILFDDDSRKLADAGSAHCGRRFETSAKNRHSPNTAVHPDLAVLRSRSYGVIAEAKLGFNTDKPLFEKRIQETVKQIEKYDDDLTGWPKPTKKGKLPVTHDLVLLVNIEDVGRATRKLRVRRQNGTFTVERDFAIVSIARVGRATGEWPTLALEDGQLSDPVKTTKLQDKVLIRPDILATSPRFGLVRLYDEIPPLPITMDLVHKSVVMNLTPDEQEQYNVEGHVDKRVTVDELQEWLSVFAFRRTDRRDPVVPDRAWINQALAKLVEMGWATRKTKRKEVFIYHHKKGRKGCRNPLERFVEVCGKDKAKAEGEHQRRKDKELEKLKQTAPLFVEQIETELGEQD